MDSLNIDSVITSDSISNSASASTSASTSTSASASTSTSASTSASGMVEPTGNLEKQLPNTGSEDSNSSVLLGGLAAITGISLFAKRRKDENEDEI